MTSYKIDRERWWKLTIFEQMGNIGSEVGRSFTAQKFQDSKRVEAAMIRALDLFDATVEQLIKTKSPKAKEVLRAKEQFLEALSDSANENDRASLDRYFFQFALAARRNR